MSTFVNERLSGKSIWAWRQDDEHVRTVIIVLAGEHFKASIDEVAAQLSADAQVALVGIEGLDWNRDLTPWPAPELRKDEPFLGQGRALLDWMIEALLPWMQTQYDGATIGIMGYSLGGLMALWCGYETGMFFGCASCSGSLWYDGWAEYANARRFSRETIIYLSLGESEERARNQRLARVGDLTRQMATSIDADSNVVRSELRWYPGGHFDEPNARMADAINWLVEHK